MRSLQTLDAHTCRSCEAYLFGDLEEAEVSAFLSHSEGCSACQDALRKHDQLSALLAPPPLLPLLPLSPQESRALLRLTLASAQHPEDSSLGALVRQGWTFLRKGWQPDFFRLFVGTAAVAAFLLLFVQARQSPIAQPRLQTHRLSPLASPRLQAAPLANVHPPRLAGVREASSSLSSSPGLPAPTSPRPPAPPSPRPATSIATLSFPPEQGLAFHARLGSSHEPEIEIRVEDDPMAFFATYPKEEKPALPPEDPSPSAWKAAHAQENVPPLALASSPRRSTPIPDLASDSISLFPQD